MSNEKLSPNPLNSKSEYYAQLEQTLITNVSGLIDFLGLDWLQSWLPISFSDLTTADQIAARKNNFELIALGQLFRYNIDHPENPNTPYSPGISSWTDLHKDGKTQSYHLFLSTTCYVTLSIFRRRWGKNRPLGEALVVIQVLTPLQHLLNLNHLID